MKTENIQNNDSLTIAKSITPDGQGLVTASLLYGYLESYNQNKAMSFASPEVIDWDVESINIRCNGRDIIKADAEIIEIGEQRNRILLDDSGIGIYNGEENEYGRQYIKINSMKEIEIQGHMAINMNSDTAINLYCLGDYGESLIRMGENEINVDSKNINVEAKNIEVKSHTVLELYGDVKLMDIQEFVPGSSGQNPLNLGLDNLEDPKVVYYN